MDPTNLLIPGLILFLIIVIWVLVSRPFKPAVPDHHYWTSPFQTYPKPGYSIPLNWNGIGGGCPQAFYRDGEYYVQYEDQYGMKLTRNLGSDLKSAQEQWDSMFNECQFPW